MTPLGPGRYLMTAVLIVLILRFFPRGLAGIPEFVAAQFRDLLGSSKQKAAAAAGDAQ